MRTSKHKVLNPVASVDLSVGLLFFSLDVENTGHEVDDTVDAGGHSWRELSRSTSRIKPHNL